MMMDLDAPPTDTHHRILAVFIGGRLDGHVGEWSDDRRRSGFVRVPTASGQVESVYRLDACKPVARFVGYRRRG